MSHILILLNPALPFEFISAVHYSAIEGHSGVPVIYRKMNTMFSWKGLKAVVHQFVQSCIVCQ
jgi:hypothetical protein